MRAFQELTLEWNQLQGQRLGESARRDSRRLRSQILHGTYLFYFLRKDLIKRRYDLELYSNAKGTVKQSVTDELKIRRVLKCELNVLFKLFILSDEYL